MTIETWVKTAKAKLGKAGISTATLDTEVLLADVLEKDRSWLHAHPEISLTRLNLVALDEQVARRAEHEPIAYIRGKQEFYGRDFLVSPDTLTPRPETETMIELMLAYQSQELGAMSQEELQIVDVGTGSGCIIITTALQLLKTRNLKLETRLLGLDISKPALMIARKNAKRLKAAVDFKEFDLLKDDLSRLLAPDSKLLVLANLPYVPANFKINLAASHEPAFAIYGGEDGLDYYRELFAQLGCRKQEAENRGTVVTKSSLVFTEALPPQHEELAKIAQEAGFTLKKTQDLIQVFKRA